VTAALRRVLRRDGRVLEALEDVGAVLAAHVEVLGAGEVGDPGPVGGDGVGAEWLMMEYSSTERLY
jgi:hypothetical protein